jgi:hypothetical protein
MAVEFKKAVKTKSRLRLAIDGVSGSGKTYTALAVASGMGGRIALIDTEHGSASLYADRFDFDAVDLKRFQIEDYIEALDVAAKERYDTVIIDSTSHAWDALVERVERIASQKHGGNTFRAWGEGTPLQRKLIEAMLSYPGHMIVTCRSKTEYSVDKDDKGKTTIRKVGTAAVQRQGFEYEFTMAMSMDANHVGMITKDRTGKFQDQFIEKPGKKLGQDLVKWLSEGAVDFPRLCKEKMAEIGNIVKTDHDGISLFTDEEIEDVRFEIRELMAKPYEKQSAGLEKILSIQKEKMLIRLSAFNAEPVTPPSGSGKDNRSLAPSMYEEEEPPVEPDGEDYEEYDETPPGNPAGDDAFEDEIPELAPAAKPRGKRVSSHPAAKDTFDIF